MVAEFRCPECNTVVPVLRFTGDIKAPLCPKCQTPTQRIISPIGGIVFQGTGWSQKEYGGRK